MNKRIDFLPICYFFLFISLMVNGRLRLDPTAPFHFGGAEYAISPFDIPLVGIFIFSLLSTLWKKTNYFIKFDSLDISLIIYLTVLF
ncbi:hypothetical protein J4U20_24140, partial [Escherichia coli]